MLGWLRQLAGGRKPPAVHAPDNSLSGQVLEAACLLTAKLGGLDT